MLKEIKQKFLNFFEKKGHLIIPSYSLLPKNDPSLLFINSGMAPLKKFFINEDIPKSKRIANSQFCLRVGGKHNDLADVGYTKRHHTFFEMLGNFSFGDYFKNEAINYSWEFLTKELSINSEKLYISIHPDDKEAFEIWSKIVPIEKIHFIKGNIWSMGEVGPFGYCSEIFYDLEVGEGNLEEGDRFLEIWNIVFMQYYKDHLGERKLPNPCIDAGMGLERIVSVIEGKSDTYDISFFINVLKFLNLNTQNIHSKIFLDHLRSVSFLIQEGVEPNPNGSGYVLRRLIRRMLKSFDTLKLSNLKEIIENILNEWSLTYGEFEKNKIIEILLKEKELFEKVLENGMKYFEKFFAQSNHFSKETLFLLHDTYGLSCDIIVDLLKEKNGTCDFTGFEILMEEHNEKNKKASLKEILPYANTSFIDNHELNANLIGSYSNAEKNYLIFDQTPFYAESGGQIGDSGICIGQNFHAKIIDTKKHGKIYLHEYEIIEGEIKNGPVSLKIDKEKRLRITQHHSSVHLMHDVLCKIYPQNIKQMGSYVSEEKFRLDISINCEISSELIEKEMQKLILNNTTSHIEEMKLEEALKIGAKAYFDYDDIVRVVKIGPSIELCGGTHIKATGDLGGFKILKISSIKAGVKRIEGIAGFAYFEYIEKQLKNLEEILAYFKCNNIIDLMNKIKADEKKSIKNDNKIIKFETIIENYKIGMIIINENNFEIENFMSQNKIDLLCVYIEKNEKAGIIIKNLISKIDAREIVKDLAKLINGKGAGGKSSFAQTGGLNIEKKEILFEELKAILKKFLN